jgi:hypothetical protein
MVPAHPLRPRSSPPDPGRGMRTDENHSFLYNKFSYLKISYFYGFWQANCTYQAECLILS